MQVHACVRMPGGEGGGGAGGGVGTPLTMRNLAVGPAGTLAAHR